MKYIHTDGKNKDFITLCHELDCNLNELAGGEENRSQHIPYNQLDDIHDVIVVYDNDLPIGCGSFKEYDRECAEVKRVFIKESYRGKGISKELMKLLEEKAREKGYDHLILETGRLFSRAIGLYRSIGYETIPNYGQYEDMSDSICLRKYL